MTLTKVLTYSWDLKSFLHEYVQFARIVHKYKLSYKIKNATMMIKINHCDLKF